MRAYRNLTATRAEWECAKKYANETKWPDVAYSIEYALTHSTHPDAITIPFYSKVGCMIALRGIDLAHEPNRGYPKIAEPQAK